MTEENEILETLKQSHLKGIECMQAIMNIMGGKKKEKEKGIYMTPENSIALAHLGMNLLKMVTSSFNDTLSLKEFREQTESTLREAFETQEQKLNSTVN